MLTFIKLFSWAKGHWKLLAGIVTLAITLFGGIQSCRATRAEREQLRLEGKLEEQKADQDKLYAERAEERKQEALWRAEARLEREKLAARIRKMRREGEEAKRALEKEKEKTAKLEPTELVAQIVERIGFESDLTKSGLYLFTRIGAERTLDRFKDGEFYLSEYNKFQEERKEHDLEVAAFSEALALCEEAEAKNFKGWDDCRETLATAIQDNEALKKIGRASKWKGRAEGAVGGGLAVFVFGKLFKLF